MAEFLPIGISDINNVISPEQQTLLKQFGLSHTMQLKQFSFSVKFEQNNALSFISDLFSSQDFQAAFPLPDITGKLTSYIRGKQQVSLSDMTVTAKHVQNLMPALSEKYCNGDTFKGMSPTPLAYLDMDINYLIDSALFDNTQEDFKSFPSSWRDELLCALFMIFRAGGSLNQQSEQIEDYVNLSLSIYKSMVKPVRLEAEDKLTLKHIHCYRVLNLSNYELFPSNPDLEIHPGNKCFVVIDELRRFIWVYYNAVWV